MEPGDRCQSQWAILVCEGCLASDVQAAERPYHQYCLDCRDSRLGECGGLPCLKVGAGWLWTGAWRRGATRWYSCHDHHTRRDEDPLLRSLCGARYSAA